MSGQQCAYWWVDGIDTTLRETDDPRPGLLLIIGVTADGPKEWVAIHDRLRESTASWLEVLRDLKERGLTVGPRLALGDGALGIRAALEQVYPDTVPQRCWFHKMGNVLAALPKHLQGQAEADLQAIRIAASHQEALLAFERFVKRDEAKYKATANGLARLLLALQGQPVLKRTLRRNPPGTGSPSGSKAGGTAQKPWMMTGLNG